jgi:Chlorophyll A-B binding protein
MADKSKKDTKKVDAKPAETNPDAPGFGWSRYAEQINGRFAMIGFISLLLLEVFTQQDIFTWLGLR